MDPAKLIHIMLLLLLIISILFLFGISFYYKRKINNYLHKEYEKTKERHEKIEKLKNNSLELSPKEFEKMRRASRNDPDFAFSGVYILHNETKDLYYIGQAKTVPERVNSHFSGRGNGDVYADYKYGDTFTIKMIALENSEFRSLNELERCAIEYYDAYRHGYNRTRGNNG